MMGFSAVSFIPVTLGFGAELTFPLQPALVNGSLMLAGQLLAFFQCLFFAFLMDVNPIGPDGEEIPADEHLLMVQDKVWWTVAAMCMVTSVAFFFAMFIKEDLKRLNYSIA